MDWPHSIGYGILGGLITLAIIIMVRVLYWMIK